MIYHFLMRNSYDSLSYDTDMSGHARGHQNFSHTSSGFITMRVYRQWQRNSHIGINGEW